MEEERQPTPLEALKAAQELIRNPRNWIKGDYAHNDRGHTVEICGDEACQWCAAGALFYAYEENLPGIPSDRMRELEKNKSLVRAFYWLAYGLGEKVDEFVNVQVDYLTGNAVDVFGENEADVNELNDAEGTTHEQVMAAFGWAIEQAEIKDTEFE